MKQLYKWGGVIPSVLILLLSLYLPMSLFSCKSDDDNDSPTYYTITISSPIENGSVEASKKSASSGESIKLTAKPATGYELDSYSVTDSKGSEISVTNGEFKMPASSVTVSATFKKTQASKNQKAADAVIAKINAIGTVAYTSDSKALIDAARSAYDALTSDQKALVTNYGTLTTAESSYSELKTAADNQAAVPEGAINGKFTINAGGDQVYFSQGNLKYNGSAWSFFDNQYDYYTSYSADAWDKFGWSTSATTYGMNTSELDSEYSGDFVDWGATMGTGWFTLSSAEWTYLFNTRSASTVGGTENGRYAKAKVNDVQGIILFPDTYTHPDGVTAPTGVNATDDTGWNGNNYSSADWTKMESAGCVFLPAAGCLYMGSVGDQGTYGYYWSATPFETEFAYFVFFKSDKLVPARDGGRSSGYSVRLVQEVE